jgi:hypothetical protein
MRCLRIEPLEARKQLSAVAVSLGVAAGDTGSRVAAGLTDGTHEAPAFVLIASNTAPTLVGASHLNAIYEDDTSQPGTRVAALVEGFVTDPDGPARGMAVTAAVTTSGTWQFATDGTTWLPLGDVSTNAARLLAADTDTRIRFVPNPDSNGTIASALTFRAWDGSAGTAEGGLADTTVNGGNSAFSSATASSSIIVYGMADGPRFTTAQTTITLNEDSPAQSIAGFVTSFTPGSSNPAITGNGYAPSIQSPGLSVDVVDVATIPQSVDPNSGSLKPARTNYTLFAPGDASRLFVNDMRGKLWIIQDGTLLSTPFLDIPSVRGGNWIDDSSSINSERGFSTFAFHPDFNDKNKPGYHRVYTVHTESPASAARGDFGSPSGTTVHYDVLSEWTVDATNPNRIDTSSRRELLRLAQPLIDHNMNQVAFNPTAAPGSPDYGMLYIGVGDGGNTGNVRPLNIVDQYNIGQNRQIPFGKILRIDPLGTNSSNGAYGIPADNPFVAATDPTHATLDEIWALGLRNPQRFSWDTVTRKMLISDIGQKNAEEINLGVAGANYGWSEREGMFVVDHSSGNQTKSYGRPANDASFGYTYPVATYDRSEGIAIVGGFVYRGSAMPYLQGKYIFGDLNTGKIYFADVNDLALGAQANIQQLTLYSGGVQKTLLQILGGSATRTDLRFGLDADGEIYLTTKYDGKVRTLAPRTQDPTWTPPATLPDVSAAANLADNTASYRVSNLSNASLFTVQPGVAANGTLTFTPAAKAFGTATFTLTAEDAGGTAFGRVNVSAAQTITITIAPTNHQPTTIALSAASINENASVGTAVGTLSTSDVDPLDTFTYALVSGTGSTDNAAFTIVGTTLKTAAGFNYEVKSSYAIRVRSTDLGGFFTEKQFTVSVTNVNEAPTITSGATGWIPENSPNVTVIYSPTAIDPDASDSITYSIKPGVGDAALVEIDPNYLLAGHGHVTLKTPANFETKSSYSFTVVATDVGSLSDEKTVIVSVTNANETPTNIALSASSVAENASVGTTIGTLSTTDVDAGDTFTYMLVAGTGSTDNASFTIVGSQLKTAASFNYEAKSIYSVRVRSTDAGGLTTEKQFTINVTHVNETPSDIALSATSVAENASVGTAVGTLFTSDVDPLDTFTYALVSGTGDADNAAFTIVGTTLKTAAVFNYEVKSSYAIRVRSTDAGGHTAEKQLTIAITNVNEAPTDISLSATTVLETAAPGTVVGVLFSSDIDAGESFTYTLVAGTGSTDNGFFTIDGGLLKTAASFNYEAKSSYSIRVRSTDAGGLTSEKQFTGSVLDLPEPIARPIATVPNVFSVIEDQATGLVFTGTPFTDADSPATRVMTVTLRVAYGSIAARSADGVVVGGKATARTFSGTLTALNAFFTAVPARITYTPVANSTTARLLTTTISEPNGLRTLSSTATSTIAVTAVDDAPTVSAPGSFTVKEDIRGNLAWPAQGVPFADIDSSSLTVTLSVPDGAISAASTAAVAVRGTATARSFTGTTAALNAYFRKLGSIGYTSAPNSTAAQTLTTTVSDGNLSASKVSTIRITPLNDAPTIYAAAALTGGRPGIPYEITYESLKTAANVADVETANPGILIQAINSGSVQKWNGTAWVAVSAAANAPLFQKLVSAGQKLRWLPPVGAVGNQSAFKIKAWDGAMTSAMTTQVFVSLQ